MGNRYLNYIILGKLYKEGEILDEIDWDWDKIGEYFDEDLPNGMTQSELLYEILREEFQDGDRDQFSTNIDVPDHGLIAVDGRYGTAVGLPLVKASMYDLSTPEGKVGSIELDTSMKRKIKVADKLKEHLGIRTSPRRIETIAITDIL